MKFANGMVFTADYLRNVETRTLIGIDVNHQAMPAPSTQPALTQLLPPQTPLSVAHRSIVQSPTGATMADYATNGLGTALDIGAGCTSLNGIGRPCAFGGVNQGQAQMFFLKPDRTIGL